MATGKRNIAEELHGAIVKRKRPKLQLSNLPMDVLCSVLSRLPMEAAIRTSILSSQWRYMWRHQTSLTFSYYTMMMPQKSWPCSTRRLTSQEFIKRVDAILMQLSGAGAAKFGIYFDLNNRHAVDIDRWVNFAIASKTKALILESYFHSDPYGFPFQLFDADNGSHLQCLCLSSISMKVPTDFKGFSNLKRLYLSGVSLTDKDLGHFLSKCNLLECLRLSSISMKVPIDFKGFSNLKRLYLSGVSLTDKDLGHFLSKCNLLEFLGISNCTTLMNLTIPHSSNQLKHLQVNICPLLREIQLNCGLTLLEYRGHVVSLVSSGTLSQTDIRIVLEDVRTSLDYLFNGTSSTASHPEMLIPKFGDLERAIPKTKAPSFLCLRNVMLDMTIVGSSKSRTDLLDLGYLLQAAPSMEKLGLHMMIKYYHKPYHQEDGELRSLPSHHHSCLKLVHITGFYGHKDQLELAVHILRNCVALEDMKVDPRVAVDAAYISPLDRFGERNLDGFRVASEFLCSVDHRRVLDLVPIFPSSSSFKEENKALSAGGQVAGMKRKKCRSKKE